MGSKARHAKYILPIILADRKPEQWYIEPFVGGGNVIQYVQGNRLGADINEYIIALLCAIRDGWIPPDSISESQYKHARASLKTKDNNYSKEFLGFVGICCSYAGKWFSSYARGKDVYGNSRNYAREGRDNLLKQAPLLKGIDFMVADYRDLTIPYNSIVYNDPPYIGTTKYKHSIDYDEFWDWCNKLVENNHKVFVSGYSAPKNWQCVWEKQVCSSLTQNTGSKKATERLFTR